MAQTLRRAVARTRRALRAAALVLLPARCGGCGASLVPVPRTRLCGPCAAQLERNEGPRCGRCDAPGAAPRCRRCSGGTAPPFAGVRAPLLYGGAIAALLAACKFGGDEALAAALAHLALPDAALRARLAAADALVPVPLGGRRLRQRGFNQSALIAATWAASCGVPVRHLLRRRRHTPPQSTLPLAARGPNVRQLFAALRPCPGNVVLVDDVVTSAETVTDAARALVAAGATSVHVVAVARAAARPPE